MTSMTTAILPMFALIAVGWALRQSGLFGAATWPPVERLVYYVCFPALLVMDVASIPAFDARMAWTVVAVGVVTLGLALAALLTRRVWAPDGASFTSFFQGAVRFNSYILIGAAPSLPDAGAAGLVGVVIAGMVIISNTLSIGVLSAFSDAHGAGRPSHILRQLVRNPLVLSSVVGIAISASHVHLPTLVVRTMSIAGSAALPLALFSVGAGLRLERAQLAHRSLWLSCGVKLLVMPLGVALACRALGLSPPFAHVALLYALVPPATSAYVLTRQLGGNAPLMASIVSVSTGLSLLTMPLLFSALA